MKELYDAIRTIPNFPKKGVMFRDITPLIKTDSLFAKSIELFAKQVPSEITKIVAIESRGFIFGGALACLLRKGFVPIRKKGKLPWKTHSVTYDLEYGTDSLHMHHDAVNPGDKVLIVDDLLATGGTVKATTELVEHSGGKVIGIAFLIELIDLKGRDKLKGYPVFSLIKFRGE